MKALALASALLLAALPGATSHAAPSWQDSEATLVQMAALLERAAEAPEPGRSALVRAALAALDADPTLSGYPWLREPLTANPPELIQARTRVTAARALLAPLEASLLDPAAARQELLRILADPPLARADWLSLLPPWAAPVAQGVVAWLVILWNLLRWPVDRLLDLLGEVTAIAFTAIALVLALLVGAGVAVLYWLGLRSTLVAQAETATGEQAQSLTSASALARSRQHASESHYRDACHYLFLSVLLWLDESQLGRFDPAATNREHLRQVGARPATARALAPAVAHYDHLRYSGEPVNDRDYEELLALVESAQRATP